MSSPGRSVYTFMLWLMLIPFTAFSLLIAFVTIVSAATS